MAAKKKQMREEKWMVLMLQQEPRNKINVQSSGNITTDYFVLV